MGNDVVWKICRIRHEVAWRLSASRVKQCGLAGFTRNLCTIRRDSTTPDALICAKTVLRQRSVSFFSQFVQPDDPFDCRALVGLRDYVVKDFFAVDVEVVAD